MSSARARAPTNRRSRNHAAPGSVAPPPRLSIPDEPPKVPRRPPSKGNKRETLADIAKRIPVQLMRQYFNYPLRSAAEAMHISVTTLKRLCRRHGVKRWPHRQISGINRALNDLEAQHEVASDGEVGAVADQLRQLHRRREVIIELAFESDDEASRKSCVDAPPPAAHKRGHRSTVSSDSNSSSTTTSSVSSHSLPGSLASAPESPVSSTSIDENKPTSVWWQHTPESNNVPPPPVAEPIKIPSMDCGGSTGGGGGIVSGVGRPRRSGPGSGSGSSRGRAPRTQRSSAMFSNIPRPGKTGTTPHHRRKASSSGITSTAAGGSVRRMSSSASPPYASGGAAAAAVAATSRASSVNGGGAVGTLSACHQLSGVASTTGAGGRSGGSSSCSNLSESGMPIHQQIDDLAALGDLLFGPDETAAAAVAEARGHGLMAVYPGIFSHNASQWAPCVPYCPPGVFSHDQALLGMPSPFSQHEHGFSTGLASASNWGGIGADRNGLGVPTSSVGPL